jgi:CHAT domain-containing protein
MSMHSASSARGPLLAALFAAAGLLTAVRCAPEAAGETSELLILGQSRERGIAAAQSHVYRVAVPSATSLRIAVEQRGIDLAVEARLADQPPVTVDAPSLGWGAEALLLAAPGAMEIRLEVRASESSVLPGGYRILVEELPGATAEDVQRIAAEAAMSRGGQDSSTGTPESLRRALIAYREALSAWRTLGERRGQAEALNDVAFLERQLGDLRPALTDLREALDLWREIGEPHREAAITSQIGIDLLDLGEVASARETLEQARDLWQRLDQPLEVEEARRCLCLLEQKSGSLPRALTCFQEILPRFQELGDRLQKAIVLNSIGGIYDQLGEPDAALEHYDRALALRTALKNRQGEAQTLNNLGVVHRGLGEWQEALRLYGQAREILAPLEDRRLESAVLGNLGFVYNSLGESQRALAFWQEALALRRDTGDRRGEVITLNYMGLAYSGLGESVKALDFHRQALALAVALGDERQEAATRLRMGEAELMRGDPKAAHGELKRALDLFTKLGNQRLAAQALSLGGRALARAGQPRDALPLLADALARRRALRDRPGEAETLQDLATVERDAGLAQQARSHVEEAVALVEGLRRGFVTPNLRAAFLATQSRAYELQIDLLMLRHAADPAGGSDREALAVSERARARSLLDTLYQGTVSDSGVPLELRERRNALRRRLSAKAYQQQSLADRSGDSKDEAFSREIDLLLTDLDGVEAEIRQHDPRYAAFREPRPLGAADVAALLEPGTLLLEYSLGEERSVAWAIGAGIFRSFSLPSGREIESLARQVHDEMSVQESGAVPHRKAAQTLSRLLLAPVWKLAAKARRLVIVPDAALHYVPFAALPVPPPGQGWKAPGEPLLLRREVVFLPSATTLSVLRQRLAGRMQAPHWAAVLADPVFGLDDPRLAKDDGARSKEGPRATRGEREGTPLFAFERLGASRKEATDLAGLAPAGEVRTVLDFAASRQTVLSGELRSYRVLHFATHGLIDSRNPELSGLVLSQVDSAGQPIEGFLRLPDVYDLDLGADLVVLSGCRTALGKEIRGEGLMGMTRGFLYAGVPRVMGTLWRVEDRAAATLMLHFYRALWQKKLSPSAALRDAQLALRRERRYRDPHSWAAFVLQGEWR